MSNKIEAGQHFLHYSKGVYLVLCVARNSDTNTDHVVFYPPDRPSEIWTRPLEEFEGTVHVHGVKIKRFTQVEPIA